MARVDSLLRLATEQGADELHLGTGSAPKMFAAGAQKKLSIPETTEITLRHLLGELLSEEAEAALRAQGKVHASYESGGSPYAVELTLRPTTTAGGPLAFDVVLKRQTALSPAPPEVTQQAPPRQTPEPGTARFPRNTPAPIPAAPAAPTLVVPSDSLSEPRLVTLFADRPLTELLGRALNLGASDVHLAAGERAFVRVAGALRPLEGAQLDAERVVQTLLGQQERERLDAGRSVDFALEAPSLGRFRGNAYRTRGRFALALRLLRSGPPDLAELCLPASLDDLALRTHGLVIVAGPTGSGKSTTLAALARRALERRAVLVLSLEDPIEYALDAGHKNLGVARQRQVGADVCDFPTGLRDALREDPDVLLVGEMRDPESIGLALTAAETGHLVLTSLHARSASSAIERIADAYAPERQKQVRVQLADTLAAVVVQRLLPGRQGGRVVAMEVLRATSSVQNLIREGRTAQLATAMQAGQADGMLPFERSLAQLVKAGAVDLDEARAVANDRDALAGYVR